MTEAWSKPCVTEYAQIIAMMYVLRYYGINGRLWYVYPMCLVGFSVFYRNSAFVTASPEAWETNIDHLFVSDPVSEALEYVETIEQQRHNCSFGPTLNLQYNKQRWNNEAQISVQAANLLSLLSTRTGKHLMGLTHQDDVNLLYSLVRANVDNYRKVFGSAIAFDFNLYNNYEVFCPYAFVTPAGFVTVKDLSTGYNYHNNVTDWFWVPYQRFYGHESSLNLSQGVSHGLALKLTSNDGYWTQPYFDCGGGDVWMVTFSMPFFVNTNALANYSSTNREYTEQSDFVFAGVTTIDIVLDNLDINQCPVNADTEIDDNVFDPFINTHKCHQKTTKCVHVPHQGFKRGTYLCECLQRYYFPDTDATHKMFNGSEVEEEYSKMIHDLPNHYQSLLCLPCAPGCDDCVDGRPCVLEPNMRMRFGLSMVQCLSIVILLVLAIYTFIMREHKVIKAASPGLLYVFLIGVTMLYLQIIVDGLLPVRLSCILLPWFKYIGFSLAYGALLFKTWRITVVFKVRSAKPIRITDSNLYLRVAVLVAIVTLYLGAWMVISTPETTTYWVKAGMKYTHCLRTYWTYIGEAGQILLLAWGVYLCVKVRKAPSAFNEAKYISVSIYNEMLMALFSFAFIFVMPTLNGGTDIFFVAEFCQIHISVTVMVILLFGSKIYHVYYNTEYLGNKKRTRTNKLQTIDNGMVYTLDTANPGAATTDVPVSNPEVQDEVARMKEVLVEIANAMRLEENNILTPTTKRSHINEGYEGSDTSSAPGTPDKIHKDVKKHLHIDKLCEDNTNSVVKTLDQLHHEGMDIPMENLVLTVPKITRSQIREKFEGSDSSSDHVTPPETHYKATKHSHINTFSEDNGCAVAKTQAKGT